MTEHELISTLRRELTARKLHDTSAGLLALEMAGNVIHAEKTAERNAAAASLARLIDRLGLMDAPLDEDDALSRYLVAVKPAARSASN